MLEDMDLTGQLLIAMPGMGDPRFTGAVIFLCVHSPEGTMGLIVNKPTGDLVLRDLLVQLEIEIEAGDGALDLPVHFGGPVEHGRGFVLHETGYESSISTLRVSADFAMTATLDILEDMAAGRGPGRAIVALGYAGWGPEQLEGEIAQNAWLVCPATPSLVFERDDAAKWQAALTTLGINPLALSSEAGRA